MSYNSKYFGNQVQNSLDWIAEAGGVTTQTHIEAT